MHKKQLPLTLLRDIASTIKTCRDKQEIYADIINSRINELEYSVTFIDKDTNSNFFFSISNPTQTSDLKSVFKVTFLPKTPSVLKEYSNNLEVSHIWQVFDRWVQMIEEYNSINLTQDETFLNQYQKEYFEEFKIVDEDANYTAFDDIRQIALFNVLSHIQFNLEQQEVQDEAVVELINDTQDLKNNIQNLTKTIVISRFSKILAKIKKKGIPFLNTILKEAGKELIKKVISEGFEFAIKQIHH